MSFTIAPGESKTATVVFTDAQGAVRPLPPGHIPVWAVDPPYMTLAPSADGMSCGLVAGATLGVCTLTATVEADPVPGIDMVTAAIAGTISTNGGGTINMGTVDTLRAVFTMADGTTFEVKATDGVDAGDYVGEFVHQKCIRVMPPGTDWWIFFRRDADGSRPELVVERGRIFDQSIPAVQIQQAYEIKFFDGTTLLATIDSNAFWRFGRGRWPNTQRPFKRTIQQIISLGWVPPYTKASGINTNSDTTTVNVYRNWMDCAGLWWDGSTGERREIGPITESQADYILNATANALADMSAQAEANASITIHYRDETTGAPLNTQAKPYMNVSRTAGAKQINLGPQPIDPGTGVLDKRYRLVDDAHHGDCNVLLYLLTDDPYHLEEMQFTAIFGVVQSAFFNNQFKLPGLLNLEQIRGWAWGKRSHFRAAKFSPETPPSWLLPASVFRANLNDNLTYANMVMASPALAHKLFRAISKVGGQGIWQKGYESFELGHAAYELGFTEWQPFYRWHLQALLDVCNGTSGWNPLMPMVYVAKLHRNGFDSAYLKDTSQDANCEPSYAQLWADWKADNLVNDSAWDLNSVYDKDGGPDYIILLAMCLKRAVQFGFTEAAAPLARITNAWKAIKKPDGSFNYDATKPTGWARWSV